MEEEKIINARRETNPTSEPTVEKRFCTNCGAELSPGQAFCPVCGERVEPKTLETVPEKKEEKLFCVNCGAELLPGQTFCPNCGHKVGRAVTPARRHTEPRKKKSKGKTVLLIAVVILAVIGFSMFKKSGPNLEKVFEEYCSSSYAEIAADGSYLKIDTNPNNIDDYYDVNAYYAIENVNKELGVPRSVLERMGQTRALDGTQSYSTDELDITWTYHPDKGLAVIYSVK